MLQECLRREIQPFGYTGYRYDAITGTYFAQAREYRAGEGRFGAKDLDYYIKINKAMGLNQYLYCTNNPFRYVDLNGHDCYVFYLPEWESEAKDDQKRLMKQYDIGKAEVHLIEIVDNISLINAWNSMGVVDDENSVEIQTVVINTHANALALGFGENSEDLFTSENIQALENKDVESLILYGCNAGHNDYVGTNVASQFSMKVNGAPVVASDGTVYSVSPFQFLFWKIGVMSYSSKADSHFENQLVNGDRTNLGWLIYTLNGTDVIISESIGLKLKLREMIQSCLDM